MSSKATGKGKVDVKAVVSDDHVDACNIEHATELTAFAEAIARRDADSIITTREALIAVVGVAGMIEACGTAATFQRLTRTAECTGIPQDDNFKVITNAVVDELNLREFDPLGKTSELTLKQKVMAFFMPLILNGLAIVIRIKRSKKGKI